MGDRVMGIMQISASELLGLFLRLTGWAVVGVAIAFIAGVS